MRPSAPGHAVAFWVAGRLRRGRPTAQAQEVARRFVKHIRQSEGTAGMQFWDGGGSHLLRRVTADFPPQQVSLAEINKCFKITLQTGEKLIHFDQCASGVVYYQWSANVGAPVATRWHWMTGWVSHFWPEAPGLWPQGQQRSDQVMLVR